MYNCYSDHAIERARERNNGKMYRLTDILEYGYRREDFRKGSSMRKYLNKHIKSDEDTCIIYDKNVFIIRENCIVTTWKMPRKYLEGYAWDDDEE